MTIDTYEKAKSLGYKLNDYDDNGEPIYLKNNLRWINRYAVVADELQQKQSEILSFDDFEKYGYSINDYIFYNYQNKKPDALSRIRQLQWLKEEKANFIDIFDNVLSENELLNEINYVSYDFITNPSQEKLIILIMRENESKDLYNAILECPIDVKASVKNALTQGYEYIPQTQSNFEFSPFMFHKLDNKKWIHDISRLIKKLNAKSFDQIIDEGYNVDDYYFSSHIKNDPHRSSYLEWLFYRKIMIPKIILLVSDRLAVARPSKEEAMKFLEYYLKENHSDYPFSDKIKEEMVSKIISNYIEIPNMSDDN